jgi:hypothetical protein
MNPPKVDYLLEVDDDFESNKNMMLEVMEEAYQKIDKYIERYEEIQEKYREDMATDKEALYRETDLDKLVAYCERYTNECKSMENLLSVCNLGLFQLKLGTFKEMIIPKCQDLLGVLDKVLPRLVFMVDLFQIKSVFLPHRLVQETVSKVKVSAENMMLKLFDLPDATNRYVQYIDYLEKDCPEVMQKIEIDLKYALSVSNNNNAILS